MNKQQARPANRSVGMLLLKGRTFIALFILVIYFAFAAPNFTSWSSIVLMVKHSSIYGLLAIGMTLVIITGGIDLSVGAVVGLCGMVTGMLMTRGIRLPFLDATIYPNVPLIMVIAVLLAMLIGLVNGVLLARLKIPAFIATLGTMYVCRGFAMLSNGGATFPNLLGSAEHGNLGFAKIGSAAIPGVNVPYSIVVFIFVAAAAWFIMRSTPLGNQIYAVGGNERAAKLSGIKTEKVKMFVYMFSGLCAAICAAIVTSQLKAAHPATGESWEMNAIASVVLGGTSMSGGVGSIGGTIIGILVINVLNDGMTMMGVSSFWQMVIKGVVIIVAVIIDLVQKEMEKKIALQQRSIT
jgi:ribose/xylose/arabinose/galactoside ABC-type transport system permease subunit